MTRGHQSPSHPSQGTAGNFWVLTTRVIRGRLPSQSEVRLGTLPWFRCRHHALLFCNICQVAFLSNCFLRTGVWTQGKRLPSQIVLSRQEQAYLPGQPLSTAIYRFRCSKLPRAMLTSSPWLLYSPPFFTPMTLDSNPIQLSRMNCPEDQDGVWKWSVWGRNPWSGNAGNLCTK